MATVWNEKQLNDLRDACRKSQGVIKKLFIDNKVPVGGDNAWGQFFNDTRDKRQYGIYGTSAGIQALSFTYPPEHKYIQKAWNVLYKAFQDPGNKFQRKKDLAIIYKLACIAEAQIPVTEEITITNHIMDEIIRRCLPSSGWGEFYYSETEKDVEPKILSTVYALKVLRRYPQFLITDTCKRALTWLCENLPSTPNLGISEVALTGLVLSDYQAYLSQIDSKNEASNYCKRVVFEWIKKRNVALIGTQENHHFPASSDGSKGNRYLFFQPDCLVALCLIKWGAPKNQQKYLLEVMSFFSEQMLKKGGFAPDVRVKEKSTVDHLWILRLFKEFEYVKINDLLPESWYHLPSYSIRTRLLIAAGFFVIACVGVFLEWKIQTNPEAFSSLQIILARIIYGLLLVVLGGGLCVEIISNILHDKKKL